MIEEDWMINNNANLARNKLLIDLQMKFSQCDENLEDFGLEKIQQMNTEFEREKKCIYINIYIHICQIQCSSAVFFQDQNFPDSHHIVKISSVNRLIVYFLQGLHYC
jgi:HrpA-like RNA helicase